MGQCALVPEPTSNYWMTVYAEPPLDSLDRLAHGTVFDWLNRELPMYGSKVDWSRIACSQRHWFTSSPAELSAVLDELIADLPALGQVDHGGDALSPFDVRIQPEKLAPVMSALLAIPEHHYFVAEDRSWIAAFTMEGDVDLAPRSPICLVR
jgi:hypothetical protein